MAAGFSQLLAALGEARLRDAMAARVRLHVPGGANGFAPFDLADIERAIAQGLVGPSAFRLWVGRHDADLKQLGAARDGRLVPEMVASLTRQGSAIIVNRFDRVLPQLWDLGRDAERALGDAVTIAAVASFGPQSGLAPHYDSVGLIVVQLNGHKHWHFHGAPLPGSLRDGIPIDALVESDHVCLEPGDLMYVPPGLTHHCTAEDTSLHMALLLKHRGGKALIGALAAAAAQAEQLNEPLPLLLGHATTESKMREAKVRLAELLERLDPAKVLTPETGEAAGPRPIGPDSHGPRVVLAPAPSLAS